MKTGLTEISKFLSYVLRHRPDHIGLKLDEQGWTSIALLTAGALAKGYELDHELIVSIAHSSEKKRFEISADQQCIRAAQGHSTRDVSIPYSEKMPPEHLYHGTAKHSLTSIMETGLSARGRHYVHLSADSRTAHGVGQRHGAPVVLKIRALRMHGLGLKFYQASNGVWLTETVPIEFLDS